MKKALSLLICFILLHSLLSQTSGVYDWRFLYNNQLVPNTPEANLLIDNINYPIDYNSGVVNINIPLFEIKSNGITFPLSISYKTGGIKFEEKNDLIGLGWKLNVTGVIIRRIKGLPDDCSVQRWESSEDIATFDRVDCLSEIDDGLYDSEWDEFYYSFGNFSGKFIFNTRTRQITQFPLTNNQIIKTDNGFIITTPDGIKYFFEEEESNYVVSETESVTRPLRGNPGLLTGGTTTFGIGESTISYYLSKITSLNGNESILFRYKTIDTGPVIENFKNINSTTVSFCSTDPLFFGDSYAYADYGVDNKTYTRIDKIKKVIDRIDFNNGHIIFTTEENRATFSPYLTLSKIEVSGESELIKTFTFNHEIFKDQSLKPTKRLKLNSIAVAGKNNTLINEYMFGYYLEYLMPDLDMNHSSIYSQDKYGYYNGKDNNSPFYIIVGNADRSSDFNYVQSLSLKSIREKLGKETVLFYESNKYMNEEIGLRIRKIEEIDLVSSQTKVTLLEYGDASAYDFASSTRDRDYFDQRRTLYRSLNPWRNVNTYYAFPKIPGVNISDNQVSYAVVTEKTTSSSHPLDTLKIKYEFYPNEYPFFTNPLPSYPEEAVSLISGYFLPPVWGRSFLRSKTFFKFENNKFTPVEKITNEYKTYNIDYIQTGLYVKAMEMYDEYNKYIYHPHASNFNFFDILAITGFRLPVRITKEIFTKEGNIQEETIYKYDNLNENSLSRGLLMEETKIVNGKAYKKKFTYPDLYADVIAITPDQVRANEFLSRNNVQIPIRVTNYVDNKNVLTTTLFHSTYNPLKRGEKVFPNILLQEQESTVLRSTVFKRYDEFGNPIEIKDSLSGLNTIMLWGYRGEYPVAEIRNTTYNEARQALGDIAPESISQLKIPNMTLIDDLRTKLPKAHVATYTHAPLKGMLSMKDSRKIIDSYNYDDVGRLSSIKDSYAHTIAEYVYGYVEVPAGAPNKDCKLVYWNNPEVSECKVSSIYLYNIKTYGNIPQPSPIYSFDVSDVQASGTRDFIIEQGTYYMVLSLYNDLTNIYKAIVESNVHHCQDITGLDYGYIENVAANEYSIITIYISRTCQ